LDVEPVELREIVSDGTGFFGASGGIVLGIEIDQHPFSAVGGELVLLSVLISQSKIRCGLADLQFHIFSPENNEIFGFSKTISGYENGSPWLKDKSLPLSKVNSMGIDGYVYLLTGEGEIIKLLTGAPVEFKQAELTMPLHNPTRLVINDRLKHLYVLDPTNKRVVVYDTLGNLTAQYLLPNSQKLKDITVSVNEESLFILDDSKVYEVQLKDKT